MFARSCQSNIPARMQNILGPPGYDSRAARYMKQVALHSAFIQPHTSVGHGQEDIFGSLVCTAAARTPKIELETNDR
jgi:hypothetical protein